LRIKKQPIAAARSFPKARWVRPEVLVDVEYRGKTGDGVLRHPSYQGIREDLMEAATSDTHRRSGALRAAGSEQRR
jgi:ATP-dependent DNA ligase